MIWEWHCCTNTRTRTYRIYTLVQCNTQRDTYAFIQFHILSMQLNLWLIYTHTRANTDRHIFCVWCMSSSRAESCDLVRSRGHYFLSCKHAIKSTTRELLSSIFCRHQFLSAVKYNDSDSKAHWQRFCQTFSQMYFQSLLHFECRPAGLL